MISCDWSASISCAPTNGHIPTSTDWRRGCVSHHHRTVLSFSRVIHSQIIFVVHYWKKEVGCIKG